METVLVILKNPCLEGCLTCIEDVGANSKLPMVMELLKHHRKFAGELNPANTDKHTQAAWNDVLNTVFICSICNLNLPRSHLYRYIHEYTCVYVQPKYIYIFQKKKCLNSRFPKKTLGTQTSEVSFQRHPPFCNPKRTRRKSGAPVFGSLGQEVRCRSPKIGC